MDQGQTEALAADLWARLGYDGCRELREALRLRMAEHRATVAEARREAGLSRPRATRKPTTKQQAAAAMGAGFASESTMQRVAAIERHAPHLLPQVAAGELKVWAAYRKAIRTRDAAAITAALTVR